jgi:serine protease Do
LSLTPFYHKAMIDIVVVKRMNIKYLIISLILTISLVLSSGCQIITTREVSETPSSVVTHETTPIDPEWELPAATGTSAELPDIADVVAKVKPSVVAINTEVVTLDIFNRPYTQEGAGSGWIIREDGIIITNNHVVEGAKSITVTLDDGRTFPADMNTLSTDELSDLAVFKIDAESLPAATVGSSNSMRVGDWVLAIGNSLGQGIRATLGIVSRKDVSLQVAEGQELRGLIETDAAINPGNSGGPLVNIKGEVIGITNAKSWNVSIGIEGVGYAISTETAMQIIQQLINNGYVVRPWLGVGLYTVNQYAVLRYNLAVNEGVLITNVAQDSPASRAGLKPGDVIVSFGDDKITNATELTRAIHLSGIGQELEITFWREDSKKTTKAVLAESPAP